jgi:hypothetical protein
MSCIGTLALRFKCSQRKQAKCQILLCMSCTFPKRFLRGNEMTFTYMLHRNRYPQGQSTAYRKTNSG